MTKASQFYCPSLVPAGEVGLKIKRSFASKKEAEDAKTGKRPYLCQFCGCWHVTSNKTATRHKRRRKKE